jgi:Transglutaminase-like superfamily
MDTTRYYLSPNKHACMTAGRVVILDLENDKYLSLDADTSALLGADVDLLSSRDGLPQIDPASPLGKALVHLADNGILSTARPPRDAGVRRPCLTPKREILLQPSFRQHVGAHDVARYIASAMSAKCALRMCSLHRVVLDEQRKAILASSGGRMFDPARAAPLCSIYSRLRVIATGPGQCLFDSLALKRFLAKYGLFPEWIFGVHLNPFAAHCWLQHGDTLVHDSLDFVSRYTPIMAV